jgi:hypothetical protein
MVGFISFVRQANETQKILMLLKWTLSEDKKWRLYCRFQLRLQRTNSTRTTAAARNKPYKCYQLLSLHAAVNNIPYADTAYKRVACEEYSCPDLSGAKDSNPDRPRDFCLPTSQPTIKRDIRLCAIFVNIAPRDRPPNMSHRLHLNEI